MFVRLSRFIHWQRGAGVRCLNPERTTRLSLGQSLCNVWMVNQATEQWCPPTGWLSQRDGHTIHLDVLSEEEQHIMDSIGGHWR